LGPEFVYRQHDEYDGGMSSGSQADVRPGSRVWLNCALAVDIVLLTIRHEQLHVLLVSRSVPKIGQLALPGGFVLPDEDLEHAALRELREETSVRISVRHLEQLRTYGRPGRDPRGRIVSVAYLAITPDLPEPAAGTDAIGASWHPVEQLLDRPGSLAFDHDTILADGVERARAKLEYTTLAAAFCQADFTVAELRRIYEIVWGARLDPRNFHRKLTSTDFLELTGQSTTRDGGRPAALYQVREDATGIMNPPLLRKAETLSGLITTRRLDHPHPSRCFAPVTEPSPPVAIVPVIKRFPGENQAHSLDSYRETLNYRQNGGGRSRRPH
jgi:8-oxo-dGTP diphosphatase